MKKHPRTCIERLVAMFGGSSSETGRRVGVPRQLINCWKTRGRIPSRHAPVIEQVTGGRITALEIAQEHAAAVAKRGPIDE